jgi:hypothetical protein
MYAWKARPYFFFASAWPCCQPAFTESTGNSAAMKPTMTPTLIHNVTRLAIGLLTIGTVIAYFGFGISVAQGVLGGGVVMILSFLGGVVAVGQLGVTAKQKGSGISAVLVALKVPVLGLAIFALFRHFGPIAVVVGGSVVIMALVFAGLAEIVMPVGKEA